jgi:hypothetical protein
MHEGLISRDIVFPQFPHRVSTSSDHISPAASHQKQRISSGYGVFISLLPGQLSFITIWSLRDADVSSADNRRLQNKRDNWSFGIIGKYPNALCNRTGSPCNGKRRADLSLRPGINGGRTGQCRGTPSTGNHFFNSEHLIA